MRDAGPCLTFHRLLAPPQQFTNPSFFVVWGFFVLFYGSSKRYQFSGRCLMKCSGVSYIRCTERAISLSHVQCYQNTQMFLVYLAVNILDLDSQYCDR